MRLINRQGNDYMCLLETSAILLIKIYNPQGGASARLSEVKNESRRDFTPTPH